MELTTQKATSMAQLMLKVMLIQKVPYLAHLKLMVLVVLMVLLSL